uniref:Putative gamma-glutamylcyclotransferase n=1 Tax=Bionectria ochroleuca TaxID=29856 RepID=A0A8H7K8C2_BIOOC
MSGDFTAFFYGTLMAPEVFFTVCYGTSKPPQAYQAMHTFTPATLDGYCRHRVQFADYPGIIPEEGCSVRGVYATGLTDANMHKLDYFEGSEYKKVNVKVKLLKNEGERRSREKRRTPSSTSSCQQRTLRRSNGTLNIFGRRRWTCGHVE